LEGSELQSQDGIDRSVARNWTHSRERRNRGWSGRCRDRDSGAGRVPIEAMLLVLLTAMSSAALLAAAVSAARHEHAALGGWLLAITAGVLLAVCDAWAVYRAGFLLAGLTDSRSERRQEWCGKMFCLAVLLWTVAAGLFADRVASAVVRLAAQEWGIR
jgi:hypothetical protein